MKKGLRQGEPLSLFLYLIVVEGLSILINQAVEAGVLKPSVIEKDKVSISHLQYADDTMFICNGDKENLLVIKRILRLFELISGLKVNYNKSLLHEWNIDANTVEKEVIKLGCETGEARNSRILD